MIVGTTDGERLRLDRRIPERGEDGRRMALLMRSGMFGGDTRGAVITRAQTVEDLRGAYKLVHDSFVHKGYIRPRPSGIRLRPYEIVPEMATFVAKVDDRVVGVLGVIIDLPDLGLPSEKVFADEIRHLRASGAKPSESTNQAVLPEYRRSAVTTELIRAVYAHAFMKGCDEIIAAISPGHRGFYELLGARQIASVRSYSREVHDPVIVVSLHVHAPDERPDGHAVADRRFMWDFLVTNNPYHQHVGPWSLAAEGYFSQPSLLRELLAAGFELPEEFSDDQAMMIRRRIAEALPGQRGSAQARSGDSAAEGAYIPQSDE